LSSRQFAGRPSPGLCFPAYLVTGTVHNPPRVSALPQAVDADFERFRIDPAVRDRAAEVCARLGHELSDVLRALVARIARDGAIPFEMPPPESALENFMDRDPRLWAPLQAEVEAQLALDLLGRFIADRSTRIAAGNVTDRADLDRLALERDEARRLRRDLDVTDRAVVRSVLAKYGPLLRKTAE
jgi:antitoxin component of RelBE/YafQ-DinJ toxin-antitoxin module